jgi:hypothetical protein
MRRSEAAEEFFHETNISILGVEIMIAGGC